MISLRQVAHLARLTFNEEACSFDADVKEILSWIDKLMDVRTDLIEPLFCVHLEKITRVDDLQDGEVQLDVVLSNAPEQEYDMFVVPKLHVLVR